MRDKWLFAVEQEDAACAGWCARTCESLRGAEAFANTDGLDAFVAVAMGQSMRGKGGGLMQALAQALMTDMSDFKVAVFETLAASARWPSLRGRIAGSGVLGVITATLLAPRHPPAVKALMARLCGELACDAPEVVELGDPRRAEEFRKMRQQLVDSGAIKAIVALAAAAADSRGATAAAGAIGALVGVGGCASSRAALAEADVVSVLLARLQVPAPGEGKDKEDSEKTEEGEKEEAEEEDAGDDAADPACEAAAAALAAVAASKGEGSEVLRAQLCEESVLARLRALASDGDGGAARRGTADQALRCLAILGRREGKWPEVDEGLAADLSRLILFGSLAAGEFLVVLLEGRGRAVSLGDMRPLRRAVAAATKSSARDKASKAMSKALEDNPGCEGCGRASDKALLVCGGCKKAAYCSKECQRAAWKGGHKAACSGS